MLKIVEGLVDKYLLPNKHFQDYVNTRYNLNEFILIRKSLLNDVYCKYNGFEYLASEQTETLHEIYTQYMFHDIKETDIVLDIGANIGAFTIPASKRAKHVYAIEPLFGDVLNANIHKNNIKNITVYENGLGDNKLTTIKYNGRSKNIFTRPLSELIMQCGGHIDFLKCDCEGAEWSILPYELKGIRRIEMEVHSFRNMPNTSKFCDILCKAGFKYITNVINEELMIIHAKRTNNEIASSINNI